MRPTQIKVSYCKKCGAYLGDLIENALYKFGHLVSKRHTCQRR